ncbi:MAG: PD-(D/E)XK nuclease family protein [Desulfobaccales bacterium]
MANPKKPPGYSFSALELFDSCPWAYKLVRLEKIPRGESEALVTGSTVHKVVADYLNRLILNGLQTDWEWAGKVDFLDVPNDVHEIWARFWNNFVLPPGMEAPGVEKKLAFDRAWQPTGFFGPDAYFRMVVDLAYRQGSLAVIQDWKTNRVIPETVEKNLQLRIYGWGTRQALFPAAQEILLRLHFLRYGAERELLLLPEDLDTVPQELEAKIAVIEAEKHFDPTPGSFCGWCGVTAHCPVMAQALVPANILYPVNHGDAVKAATLLLAIEEMGKVIKNHLKAWVMEYGPVPVGNVIYGPSSSVSYELDPEQVVNDLLAQGLEPSQVWPMLSLTKTSLDRGLKKLKRKELLDGILGQYPSKTVEKVGFHKAT